MQGMINFNIGDTWSGHRWGLDHWGFIENSLLLQAEKERQENGNKTNNKTKICQIIRNWIYWRILSISHQVMWNLRRYKQMVDGVTSDASAKEKASAYFQRRFAILIDHKTLEWMVGKVLCLCPRCSLKTSHNSIVQRPCQNWLTFWTWFLVPVHLD